MNLIKGRKKKTSPEKPVGEKKSLVQEEKNVDAGAELSVKEKAQSTENVTITMKSDTMEEANISESDQKESEVTSVKTVKEPAQDKVRSDFTLIHGVGAATQKKLNAAGIMSYAQLAQAEPEKLAQITGRPVSTTQEWIAQAKDLIDKK